MKSPSIISTFLFLLLCILPKKAECRGNFDGGVDIKLEFSLGVRVNTDEGNSNQENRMLPENMPTLFATFKRLVGGTFKMGSPPEENDRNHEDETQVEVTISPFAIMVKELTQIQWFRRTGTNPSEYKEKHHCPENHQVLPGIDGDVELCPNHPAEGMSHNDAMVYIRKENESLQLFNCQGTPFDPKGCLRLPSEAEWEFAARGGEESAYYFGNDPFKLSYHAWYSMNSEGTTHPVGERFPNQYGIYDIYGNVGEWTADNYRQSLLAGENPFYKIKNPEDEDYWYVYRGGGYSSSAWELRSATRASAAVGHRFYSVGMRLVETL
ncbi:MAG: formylglycine-generating enzyme family protein [Halobacteriovoraceae bacterium]|nr:formylglycine-generating enzyme family protein [Halobacteriovoraceae bacterium]